MSEQNIKYDVLWPLGRSTEKGVAMNRRFADSASVTSSTPVFTPGLPRTFHAGLEYAW